MTTMKKKMMMMNKIFVLILILFFSVSVNASELTDEANKDWLELVRKYNKTSSDNFEEIESENKWSRLINKLPSTDSFLSEWWRTLGDEVLTDLIEEAFLHNRDLILARARVLEARAQLGISRTNFNPKAQLESEYEHARNSDIEDIDNKRYNQYSIGIDASWEIDFFGKNKHALEAAKANLESEYANIDSAWVSLSAEVASDYINLRILQKRLKIAENNLKIQSELLEILTSQRNSGLTNDLAVQKAHSELEITRANIPEITHSINQLLTALAILTGEIPGSLDEKLSTPKDFPDVDISKLIGIPAETLRQRPDIKAAERKLAAQIQTRKTIEKSLYPTIQLIGSIGLESFSTGHLFSSGSYNYSIGPKINWPIFNAGEIRKNIQVQTAIEKQLLAEFEGVILKAVGEVHDALNANAQEILKNQSLKSGLKSAISNLEITKNKYSQGLINFTEVLNSQIEVFSIEDNFVSSEGQKIINLITLFKSLGGGWKFLE